jgi:hypothetical protein
MFSWRIRRCAIEERISATAYSYFIPPQRDGNSWCKITLRTHKKKLLIHRLKNSR